MAWYVALIKSGAMIFIDAMSGILWVSWYRYWECYETAAD